MIGIGTPRSQSNIPLPMIASICGVITARTKSGSRGLLDQLAPLTGIDGLRSARQGCRLTYRFPFSPGTFPIRFGLSRF